MSTGKNEPKGQIIYAWLQNEDSRLVNSINGLELGHPSGSDNSGWIARDTGALDACTVLQAKVASIDSAEEVRAALRSMANERADAGQEKKYIQGGERFIDAYLERLLGA